MHMVVCGVQDAFKTAPTSSPKTEEKQEHNTKPKKRGDTRHPSRVEREGADWVCGNCRIGVEFPDLGVLSSSATLAHCMA